MPIFGNAGSNRWAALAAGLVLLAASLAGPRVANAQSAPACALAAADRAWIDGSLEAWRAASRDDLRLGDLALPWVVFFDGACVWHVNPDLARLAAIAPGAKLVETTVAFGGRPVAARGLPHAGS